MSLLRPLIDNLFELPKAIYNITHNIPKYIEYEANDKLCIGNILYIPIGINRNGTQYLVIGGETSHTYVVGQSGSGKSNLIKVILTSIINNYKQCELILLDYKLVELSLYKNTNNCIMYEWEEESISKALTNVYDIVISRYNVLNNKGLTIANNLFKPILVVIEEISLMPKQDFKTLKRIMAISRAINVYILITTQRPSNENLDNTCKSLIGNRVVFHVEDKKNSIIALDNEGAELLNNKGRGYIKANGKIVEFQAYYINDNLVNTIVKANYKTKNDIKKANYKTKNDNANVSYEFSNEEWLNNL